MPLYEYECKACGEQFEMLVSADKKDEAKACPACGSEDSARMLSTFAVGTAAKPGPDCPTCCPGGTCGL